MGPQGVKREEKIRKGAFGDRDFGVGELASSSFKRCRIGFIGFGRTFTIIVKSQCLYW